MCFTCATGGLCGWAVRAAKAAWTTSGCGARFWPCCSPRASMCGRLGLKNRECTVVPGCRPAAGRVAASG
eukprot:1741142-Prymnesium_polylepis.1